MMTDNNERYQPSLVQVSNLLMIFGAPLFPISRMELIKLL